MATWLNIANTHSTFAALNVTGVKRKYSYPPASVDLTEGPAAFPIFGEANRGEQISTCINESKSHNLSYVVLVQATGQGTQSQNMSATITMMDNVATALDALAPNAFNFIDYGVGWDGNYPVSGSDYWAVIATITVRSR